MEEYKIGDVFEYKNKKYIIKHQCIENGCKNCTFLDQDDLICSLAGAKSNNLPLCSKLDCIYEEYNEEEKKEYFDPNTLKPFDKVLVRDSYLRLWHLGLFSDFCPEAKHPFVCCGNSYRYCIPYNDETKYLLGTTEEASEYYSQYEYNNYNVCK